MIEINENEMQIEVKQVLDWNYIEEFHYNSILDMLEEDECYFDEVFNYELNEQDKKQILNYIVDEFHEQEARASYYDNYNVSIFDEEVIRKGIVLWLEEKFEVEILDIVLP